MIPDGGRGVGNARGRAKIEAAAEQESSNENGTRKVVSRMHSAYCALDKNE